MQNKRLPFLPYYGIAFLMHAQHSFFPFQKGDGKQRQIQKEFNNFSHGVRLYIEHNLPHLNPSLSPESNIIADSSPFIAGAPLLLIPAIPMAADFFSLHPTHHLINFLKGFGFCPFVLQWPLMDDKQEALNRIRQAYNQMMKKGAFHVIAFYSSVVLALEALSYEVQSVIKSFICFGETPRVTSFKKIKNNIEPLLKQKGNLPGFLTRLFFSYGGAQQVIHKMCSLSCLSPPEVEHFVACEDALNAMKALPFFLIREYLEDSPLNIFGIARPILWIRSASHRPWCIGKNQTVLSFPNFSSLGLLLGSQAPQKIWLPLVRWLLLRDR